MLIIGLKDQKPSLHVSVKELHQTAVYIHMLKLFIYDLKQQSKHMHFF